MPATSPTESNMESDSIKMILLLWGLDEVNSRTGGKAGITVVSGSYPFPIIYYQTLFYLSIPLWSIGRKWRNFGDLSDPQLGHWKLFSRHFLCPYLIGGKNGPSLVVLG